MTNKLVVIINSLKVPKIKESFSIWIEIPGTKLQLSPEPLTRGYRPQIPVLSVLCPQLNLLKPPPPWTKFLGTPLTSGVRRNFVWGKITTVSVLTVRGSTPIRNPTEHTAPFPEVTARLHVISLLFASVKLNNVISRVILKEDDISAGQEVPMILKNANLYRNRVHKVPSLALILSQ